MEPTKEELKPDQITSATGLVKEVFDSLSHNGKINVKEVKAIMYYLKLFTEFPLPYKAFSDLEADANTELSLAEFTNHFIGAKFSPPTPPTIEQLCIVIIFKLLR